MSEHQSEKTCIVCDRGSEETPLLTLEYQGTMFRVCPQHLPVLIHNPAALVGKLAGAENMEPAEHRD